MITIGKVTNLYDKDGTLYAEALDIDGRSYKDAIVYVPQGGAMNMPAELNFPCLIIKTGMAASVIPLQVANSPIGAAALTHVVPKPGRVEVTTKSATTIRDGLVKFVITKLRGFVSAFMTRLEAYINKHHFVIGNKLTFEIFDQTHTKTHTVKINPDSKSVKVIVGLALTNTEVDIKPNKTKITVGSSASKAEVDITSQRMEFTLGTLGKITISSSGINFHAAAGAALEGGNVLTGTSVVCPIIGSLAAFGNPTLTNKPG